VRFSSAARVAGLLVLASIVGNRYLTADGFNGRDGEPGGGGGGGAGGVAFRGGSVTESGNTFVLGPAGAGGTSPAGGASNGANGVQANVRSL
jgi:hypothetical protein